MTDAALNAETAVAGALLVDDRCLDDVRRIVSPGDFADPDAADVLRAAMALQDAGGAVDPVTILEKLGNSPASEAWIRAAMDLTPTAANAAAYAVLVRRAALCRRLEDAARRAADAPDPTDARAAADELACIADELARVDAGAERPAGTGLVGPADAAARWLERYKTAKDDISAACCPTGSPRLDALLGGGLFRGEMYVLAGRPGMGKTTFGLAVARRVAARGEPVLFVSLEMPAYCLTAKRVAMDAGVSYTELLRGGLSPEDETDALRAAAALDDQPLYLLEDAGTVAEIARAAARVPGLRLIAVDYLGLLRAGERCGNRYEEITRVSAELRALAKRLDLPVLALAQLNRETAARADKRPTLADLRDSGAIEQDAGGVLLLHRDGYYAAGKAPETEPLTVIAAKNRHAPRGETRLVWEGRTGRVRG